MTKKTSEQQRNIEYQNIERKAAVEPQNQEETRESGRLQKTERMKRRILESEVRNDSETRCEHRSTDNKNLLRMAGEYSAAAAAVTEEEITLTVKWSGKEYTVRVCGDDTVGELKRRICEVTNVLPKRQKLLYPKVGSKLSDDSTLLSQLPLKASLKMTMIGKSFVKLVHSFVLTGLGCLQLNPLCEVDCCWSPLFVSVKVGIRLLICTVEDDIIVHQVDSPEIIDDFELGQDEAVEIKDKEVNKQKLRRRIMQYKVRNDWKLRRCIEKY
ncbi:hypothetical protein M9H77_20907 [Catharanthus roseus]|uniref:Uncharacterized protein n=1 Tax=Catharanthus roseus TaxID=4058 RepID=A0ACC0AL91_CATRO|nr:hypothetical protein M9H77_20907 [Catharanthus roseus]